MHLFKNAVLINTDETVRTDAVISVTTMHLVTPSLDVVAVALTVIKMQNAMKVRNLTYHLVVTKITNEIEKKN